MTVRIYVRESLASYDATHIHGRQLEYREYDLATMEIASEGIEYVPNRRFTREFRKCVMVQNGRVIGTCCVRSAVSAEFYKRKGIELWMKGAKSWKLLNCCMTSSGKEKPKTSG